MTAKRARLEEIPEEGGGSWGSAIPVGPDPDSAAPPPPDMDQATANHLFQHVPAAPAQLMMMEREAGVGLQGAFLIFQDFPAGSEFGIDYQSWRVGDQFKGLKMIPPGIHFVYFRYPQPDSKPFSSPNAPDF